MIELKIKINDDDTSTLSTHSTNGMKPKDLIKIFFVLQSIGNEVKEEFIKEAIENNASREEAEHVFNELLTGFHYNRE